MKVLNLCIDDWANYSYLNAQALRSVDVDCISMKLNPHSFGYNNQCDIVSRETMIEAIRKSDVIQFVHNTFILFNQMLPYLKGKKVAVYYTGTAYRNEPEMHNALFNPFVDISFTDQCEFFGLGAKNLHYAAVGIETEKYPKFLSAIKKPYVIAHYPSNSKVKGTDEIIEMINRLKQDLDFTFKCDQAIVTHDVQISRMSMCDIYIELFKHELNGKPYGCYGVTAFEAAAMGKVVVTQNIRKDVYLSAYGNTPFIIANTEIDFMQSMLGLLNTCEAGISEWQTETYNWLMLKHSMKATGKYINKILSSL